MPENSKQINLKKSISNKDIGIKHAYPTRLIDITPDRHHNQITTTNKYYILKSSVIKS